MWAQVVNIILGLLLLFIPSFFSVDKPGSDNLYIVGTMVITFAIIAIWEVNRNVRWLNIPAGAWLLLSPFLLHQEGDLTTLEAFIGILIIVCSMFKGKVEQRYGGGWRSLLDKNPVHMAERKAAN